MIRHSALRFIAGMFLFVGMLSVGQTASAFTAGACRQDADKLCPGMPDKEASACLKAHSAELSTPCKVNLAEARQTVRDLYEMCQSDIEKYCKDVPHGQGRIRRCLKSHEADLTSDCKSEISVARKRFQAILPPQPSTATVTSTGTVTGK